eukprot:5584377-Ditylum_brightwellii.AAC.1
MDGEIMDPNMRSDNIPLLSSSAKQLLTKQGHPNWESWKTWSKGLKLFANSDQLNVTLWQWLVPTSDLQRKWPIYLDYTKDILYVWLVDRFDNTPHLHKTHMYSHQGVTLSGQQWIHLPHYMQHPLMGPNLVY